MGNTTERAPQAAIKLIATGMALPPDRVTSADLTSRGIDRQDEESSLIFGDGAACAIVKCGDGGGGEAVLDLTYVGNVVQAMMPLSTTVEQASCGTACKRRSLRWSIRWTTTSLTMRHGWNIAVKGYGSRAVFGGLRMRVKR